MITFAELSAIITQFQKSCGSFKNSYFPWKMHQNIIKHLLKYFNSHETLMAGWQLRLWLQLHPEDDQCCSCSNWHCHCGGPEESTPPSGIFLPGKELLQSPFGTEFSMGSRSRRYRRSLRRHRRFLRSYCRFLRSYRDP